MSLEALYNNAAANTYVGVVRTRQATDAPVNRTLVNFLDGQAKGTYRAGRPLTADIFQTEFTRNAPLSFLSAGAQGVARSSNQTYTRWTSKAFKLAFDGEGPSHLINGFYTNAFRPTYRSPYVLNGATEQMHKYTPRTNNGYKDINVSARARARSSASGAPTGF